MIFRGNCKIFGKTGKGPPFEYFQQNLDILLGFFCHFSNFQKIYKGPLFEYFVNVIVQTLEN